MITEIKKITCFYTDNEQFKEDSCWEGYLLIKKQNNELIIEGYENDKMDSLEKNGNLHYRYFLGKKISSNNSLRFVVYPSQIAPILYNMEYNEEDDCFYGKWHFMSSFKHPHPKNMHGDAVIKLSDTQIDINEIDYNLKKLSSRTEKEYSIEMEALSLIIKNPNFLFGSDEINKSKIKKLITSIN